MPERAGLRLRLLLFFAAILAGGLAALGAGLWLGHARLSEAGPVSSFILTGAVAGFGLLATVTWVWVLFDEHVGRALGRLAAGLRAQAHTDTPGPFDAAPGRYLGDLGPAATALTEKLADIRVELAGAVARETSGIKREKIRLEALLSDVPAGVMLCTATHQIVFYNGNAVDLLGTELGPALNRSLFTLLREAPIRHAHDRLVANHAADHAAGDSGPSDFMVATRNGERVLSGRMRLIEGGRNYVLTLRDVTVDLAAHAGQDRLLAEIFDRIRRPAAGLQTMTGILDEQGRTGDPLTAALIDEVGTLVDAVNEMAHRYDTLRGHWTPLPATRSDDLIDGFAARIEALGLAMDPAPLPAQDSDPLMLRCDGFEIVAMLAGFAQRISAAGLARTFTMTIAEDGAGAQIDLGWQGAPVSVSIVESWFSEPIDPTMPDITGQSVLTSHATECWPQSGGDGRAVIRLPLRDARRADRKIVPVIRPVTYDFDLLFAKATAALADTPLTGLTYVVFDTETTGLLPDSGDEIVQIAGVRLVNGRRVAGEVFDLLVNPGRPIPPKATEVHGISDAMVADALGVNDALIRFHAFAEESVLIAHNAPFDMTFLRRRASDTGCAFDQPVLDTVLLSAVVYGRTEHHALDALAARLGVTIPEEARHTALGDTIATAEVFLKLVPLLSAMGITTFGHLLAEVRKHGRLLRDLNA